MSNTGKFKIGTCFVGNINKVNMQVVKIEKRPLRTESGKIRFTNELAVIKNLKTGELSTYGLSALERCDVTIIENL